MAPVTPTPDWVKNLKPGGPQGTDLLKGERDQSNVNVEQLSTFLHTPEGLQRKRKILSILQGEKVFDKSQNYFAGRVDRFETALARSKKLRQLEVKHGWTQQEKQCANELVSEPGPYGLHESMFLVCLTISVTPHFYYEGACVSFPRCFSISLSKYRQEAHVIDDLKDEKCLNDEEKIIGRKNTLNGKHIPN